MAAARKESNPLFERLTAKAKWPSLRMVILIGGTLFVLTLGISASELREIVYAEVPPEPRFSTALGYLAWPLALISPLLMTLMTAIITGRDVASEAFQMMQLTTLSARRIVRGYVFTTLYHQRLLLGLVIGLSPLLVASVMNRGLFNAVTWVGYSLPFPSTPGPSIGSRTYDLTVSDVLTLFLSLAAGAGGLLLMNLMAAALGVMQTLRHHRLTVGGGFILAMLVLISEFVGVVGVLTLLGPFLSGPPASQFEYGVPSAIWVLVIICWGAPLLLALGGVALARRVLRKD